jgi:hypothetical protein
LAPSGRAANDRRLPAALAAIIEVRQAALALDFLPDPRPGWFWFSPGVGPGRLSLIATEAALEMAQRALPIRTIAL